MNFKYLNNEAGFSCPLKSVVFSVLLRIGMVKSLKSLNTVLFVKMQIF